FEGRRGCQTEIGENALSVSAIVFEPGPIGTPADDVEAVAPQTLLNLAVAHPDILEQDTAIGTHCADPIKLRPPISNTLDEAYERVAPQRIAAEDFDTARRWREPEVHIV